MKRTVKINEQRLTWAEVDLKAVRYNVRQLARLTERSRFRIKTRPRAESRIKGEAMLLAVIKAEAYGHGMERIARVLDRAGVGYFGVSDIREGKALRALKIKKPILLFESTLAKDAKDIVDHRLMPTICTWELAKALNRYAVGKRKVIDVHIKVDTGMGRLGVWHEEAYEFIKRVSKLDHLRIMGIFTHFPAADTDRRFTHKQLKILHDLVIRLDRNGIVVPYVHAANSMGLAGYKTQVVNLFRPGLMIYGQYPDLSLRKKIRLKSVLSVHSRVIFLKKVKKGRSISYGRTFFTKKDMTVATVPIGYNDGYFRLFSNRSSVLVNGARCPVIGSVTMDQIMVDVSRVRGVRPGSAVVILGAGGREKVTADELARHAGTINYEIVCSLGNRLPKVYKN